MKTVQVNLKENSYVINIASGAFGLVQKKLASLIAENRPCVCVVDSNLYGAYASKIDSLGVKVFKVESGEGSKSFEMLEDLCAFLADSKMDRSGAIFAIGGGVTGDLAGFAASIFMRGVNFYQVPTTLLSMIDSSVGGKTAINIEQGKNLIGTFYQPKEVFIDTDFLKTLPNREFAAGLAELVKYALICDEKLFDFLEATPLSASSDCLTDLIEKCCAIKAEIVAGDEKETAKNDGRALLNLGHTFAHAIEKCAGYGEYLHGEAVGIGLLLALRLSVKMGLCGQEILPRLEGLLKKNSIPTRLHSPIDADKLLSSLHKDKKMQFGKLNFVLLRGIGKAFTSADVSMAQAREVFETLR